MPNLKTWVEINKRAVGYNIKVVRKLLKPKTELWSVVKSNAYGHGLTAFSKLADKLGVDGFCIDSVIEGEKLRAIGIKKPILVLGPTLSNDFLNAAKKNDIIVTIANFDALNKFLKSKNRPQFHIKIDTGMHRQGFYPEDLPKFIKMFGNRKSETGNYLKGIYTHFASAKDLNYPTYTDYQFENFKKALRILGKAGFKKIKKHAAATGGALMGKKYHLDMARIGIGLYGLWPSKELMVQKPEIKFKPVLSWYAVISEIKNLKAGDFIGYDLTERASHPTKMAILPIGYWHGFPRALSGIGEVLINGKRARVLGRVSMDLIAVDVGNIHCKAGDRVVIIGAQKSEELSAFDIAQKINTTHYELVTRINPLIERVIV